jgi:hypothetical protein
MSTSIDPVRGVLLLMRKPGQVLAVFGALVAAFLYVWYAAVRAVPRVRRSKAAGRVSRGRAPWKR